MTQLIPRLCDPVIFFIFNAFDIFSMGGFELQPFDVFIVGLWGVAALTLIAWWYGWLDVLKSGKSSEHSEDN